MGYVMRKVIVELDEQGMARLEALAQVRQVRPADVLKAAALTTLAVAPVSSTKEAQEQRRQARLAILMRSHGIFTGDKDRFRDGLVYQNELRAEWK
jgi:hypothetical protein